jgi:hydrogenase-4 component E
LFPRVVSLLSFAVVGVAFLMVWRQSLSGRLRLFALQSGLLALLAAVVAAYAGRTGLWVVALAVLVVKVWVIPRVLSRVVPGLPRLPAAVRSPTALLLGAGALTLLAFAVLLPVARAQALPTAGGLPLALANGLIGLLLCATARQALVQVLGFLVFENGVFMLALLGTYGLPSIVEAGAFLDVLVAVLIAKVVLGEIRESFGTGTRGDVDELRELRG